MFLPTVHLRQKAFEALQEQAADSRDLHIPAEWQVGVNNVVSLAVGAGMAHILLLLWRRSQADDVRILCVLCYVGPNGLPQSTFSLTVDRGQQELHECCFGDSSLQLAQALTAAVKVGLHARSPVSIAQVYAAAAI